MAISTDSGMEIAVIKVARTVDHAPGRRDLPRVREVDQLSLQRRQHADSQPHQEHGDEPWSVDDVAGVVRGADAVVRHGLNPQRHRK